jgi:hypothetical protein
MNRGGPNNPIHHNQIERSIFIMYDYRENIKSDILEYIRENYNTSEMMADMIDREEWEQRLYDDLWICDSVTGNASGSYFFNRYRAAEAIAHNWDLIDEALREFGCDDCNPFEKGEEWCDVTIRCYLLGECLCAALDELEEMEG